MKSSEIREKFLAYFESKEHQRVDSSSLVPDNDPTLLFTNAGMNQFKDLFLGNETRSYQRATSSQRCVRAGGKHNDLENVGYTARHHTFFEMLGNFSFGDYFKEDAIKMAWEFLTKVIGLPEEKLWVTVHKDDHEAEKIWKEVVGVDPQRFSHMGDKDNFWSMGDTGPCGPCSEIFYDHGPEVPGGPPGSPDDDLDRYIEIWNLVFMQFDQQVSPDGTIKRVPLPKPSVDTGMGLERLSAILQGVHSNYEIDIFQALIKKAADLTGCADLEHKSLRVIADHIRSAAFLVSDGILPSNEGRGYVLRRIIRRAIRHGNSLGASEFFFHKLVDELAVQMGEAYEELTHRKDQIKKALKQEEELFDKTLDNGLKVLSEELKNLSGKVIPGNVVFKLYDTYGFPVDLTADYARDHNLEVDMDGFEVAMAEQRKRSQDSSDFSAQHLEDLQLDIATGFLGYDQLIHAGTVKALLQDGVKVSVLSGNAEAVVVLDQTSFYAESGGQVGDKGSIEIGAARFEVLDCIKNGDAFLHIGKLETGQIKVGDAAETRVDPSMRLATARHHSATHLLHAALREVLGEHVQQKGSLVDHEKLRFDFTHYEAVTSEELAKVEQLVNEQVLNNTTVHTELMSIDAAKKKGAMALFGEKYSDEVRVLSMGSDGFSMELCGGTHVSRTGDIGLIKIKSESGIAAGIRRIEAVAGLAAIETVNQTEKLMARMQAHLKAKPGQGEQKLQQLIKENKALEKALETMKQKLASSQSNDLVSQAIKNNGISYLGALVDGKDARELREMVDQLKNKLGTSVVMLISSEGDKVQIAVGVSKDLVPGVKAGDVANICAVHVDGRGGGKPELAMAGGTKPSGIPAALQAFKQYAEAN